MTPGWRFFMSVETTVRTELMLLVAIAHLAYCYSVHEYDLAQNSNNQKSTLCAFFSCARA